MKYLLSIIALTLSLNAQGIPDHPPGQGENRRKPPEISKEFREEIQKKYDTNKDGNIQFKIGLRDQTSINEGFSYTRVLSAIFDATLLVLHSEEDFFI